MFVTRYDHNSQDMSQFICKYIHIHKINIIAAVKPTEDGKKKDEDEEDV